MKATFLRSLEKGAVSAVASILLFPLMLLLVWGASAAGLFAWAEFHPTDRQMVLLAAAAAFLST